MRMFQTRERSTSLGVDEIVKRYVNKDKSYIILGKMGSNGPFFQKYEKKK